MDDITTRLRRWTHAVPPSDLMDEAAAEIERLRWRVMTLESAARYAEGRSATPAAYHENDEKRAVWPTIHDAVPEARADSDEARTDKAATSHRRDGTGNTPALTDAEREAVEAAIDVLEEEDQWHAAGEARIKTLRKLLARLA